MYIRLRAIDHQRLEAVRCSFVPPKPSPSSGRCARTTAALEAKQYFCQARAQIAAGEFTQAIDSSEALAGDRPGFRLFL